MNNWNELRLWRRHSKNFTVEVSRHDGGAYFECGPHRWCVYAYIREDHPHFCKFEGDDIFQDAAGELPLHWGCTWLSMDTHRGKKCVKVGADYAHCDDDHFSHYATPEEANEVFRDADKLFEFLLQMEQGEIHARG